MNIAFLRTVADANAAKVGTIIINGYGDAYQKNDNGQWYGAHDGGEPAVLEALFNGVPRPVIWVDGKHGIGYH